ncbi:myosin heavy chain, clone 203-like [Montipora foliosa]|uniref:myosin heavy chain, clone 203-like n=1 Tax=Montipora foliosa TaxID=591990 RepID=UPI0035F1625A
MLLKALGKKDRKKDQLLSELKQYRKIFMWMEKDKHVHIRARINARNDLARSNTTLQRIERTNKKVREEKEEIQKEIDALRLQLLSKENREKEEECNSINEDLRRLKHDLVEEEKERKELEAELAARTEEEKELSDETEALKSKVKELEENLKAMKDEHNKLKNENSLLQSEKLRSLGKQSLHVTVNDTAVEQISLAKILGVLFGNP